MNSESKVSQIEAAKLYFSKIDAGIFLDELFTEDFEFYYPKFGIGRGRAAFMELASGVVKAHQESRHHQDQLIYSEAADKVIVEGTTEGVGQDGIVWCGGSTPGGRFCSVFEFDTSGLIKRMYIYMDPDVTSMDENRFLWGDRKFQDW